MIIRKEIPLQESFSAYGKSDFEQVLRDELDEHSGFLPLERFCNQGGWPDDESLQFEIEVVSEANERIAVLVTCFFNEVVPTGCADIHKSASGQGTFEIVLDLEQREAFFVHDTDDY